MSHVMSHMSPGHDGIPAQTQSAGLRYKPIDRNNISSVYESINLEKSVSWTGAPGGPFTATYD